MTDPHEWPDTLRDDLRFFMRRAGWTAYELAAAAAVVAPHPRHAATGEQVADYLAENGPISTRHRSYLLKAVIRHFEQQYKEATRHA